MQAETKTFYMKKRWFLYGEFYMWVALDCTIWIKAQKIKAFSILPLMP